MATLQERLQIKRVPIDKWSVREQLCLASAVVRSGDQNWMSVSRALKPFAEPNRPPDWFSQKNCAAQYGSLLENVETPKRKKRMSGSESGVETPGESILKKLIQERKMEIKKKMEDEKREYLKLKDEMDLVKSGAASDTIIEKMCVEIEEEEKQKEKDAVAHAQWLKIREERKLEVERVFRPVSKVATPVSGQKRKVSDLLDIPMSVESSDETPAPAQETPKPALSPLLTSLLKTPSHAPNVTSSILHSAITNQRGGSPTIASLLNTTASVPVSPSLQQLVSTAISQEPVTSLPPLITLTSSSKSAVSPAPPVEVMKTEEIKEEIDENSTSETSKSETNTETNEISCEEENVTVKEEPIPNEEESEAKTDSAAVKSEDETTIESTENADSEVKNDEQENTVADETAPEQVDVYDFDNNSKTSSEEIIKDSGTDATHDTEGDNTNDEIAEQTESDSANVEIKQEPASPVETKPKGKDLPPGSVEIVEVVVMEDDDSDKEMNKKVSELKRDIIRDKAKERDQSVSSGGGDVIYSHAETAAEEIPVVKKETTVYDEYDFDDTKKPEEKPEKKSHSDSNVDIDAPEFSRKSTFTPEYTEAFFDDMAIEVTKQDKSGKAKRDYSRTKKKEEKDIDILLAVEKAVSASLEESEIMEETGSEKDSQDSDKKSDSGKTKILKDSNERSNSPWTEEEEVLPKTRRRLSATPATPSDSIPNSPASGTAVFDDDRDYRTWKKSVMLVYSRLAAHKCASLFLKPITDEHAPGYHSIVYRPMDLQTIRKNIENGTIRTTAEFQRDVLIMFNNAIMYNKANGTVYSMARQMQQEGLQQIQILLQAQTQVETPARRETRTSESGLKRKRGHDDLLKTKKRRDE